MMLTMPKSGSYGRAMYSLAQELWPINRSLSGQGVRETLGAIAARHPEIEMTSVNSGTEVYDWTVPKEWEVLEAYIIDPCGQKICDFSKNNLHLVGYSIPFEGEMELEELQGHLYSLESQPNAIPYVTSYYREAWGFCLTQIDRDRLGPGTYRVVIRTRLFDGVLDYGEILIPGESNREIFFSTYVCHPSMANNELSGPVLAVELAKWLKSRDRHFSYRFLFIPETIGSLIYMSRNLERMQRDILAGFVLTCVGDEREFSYLPSRKGDSVADKVALHVLHSLNLEFISFSWLDRGSDERQYCSPGADLPVCSVMRSKYGSYPEYHTNLDTLGGVVTERGLEGSFEVYKEICLLLESQRYPRTLQIGEPQLGRRGMWSDLSIKGVNSEMRGYIDALSLMDGKTEIDDLAAHLGWKNSKLVKLIKKLESEGLVEL